MPLLSVIVPVYNEAKTIWEILDKVNSVNIDKEIIVVNDGSSDGTDKVLANIKYNNLKVIHHAANRGKGATVLTGINHATGEFVIIQDADLEYDPNDYLKLMNAIRGDKSDIVLGARFTKGYRGSLIPRMGNRFLTTLLNILFNVKLNDCFTCYKLVHTQVLKSFNLKAKGFEVEIEIIAKAIRNKLQIAEVPISYHPRTYLEGKKIRWRDGIRAILSIMRYRFLKG